MSSLRHDVRVGGEHLLLARGERHWRGRDARDPVVVHGPPGERHVAGVLDHERVGDLLTGVERGVRVQVLEVRRLRHGQPRRLRDRRHRGGAGVGVRDRVTFRRLTGRHRLVHDRRARVDVGLRDGVGRREHGRCSGGDGCAGRRDGGEHRVVDGDVRGIGPADVGHRERVLDLLAGVGERVAVAVGQLRLLDEGQDRGELVGEERARAAALILGVVARADLAQVHGVLERLGAVAGRHLVGDDRGAALGKGARPGELPADRVGDRGCGAAVDRDARRAGHEGRPREHAGQIVDHHDGLARREVGGSGVLHRDRVGHDVTGEHADGACIRRLRQGRDRDAVDIELRVRGSRRRSRRSGPARSPRRCSRPRHPDRRRRER